MQDNSTPYIKLQAFGKEFKPEGNYQQVLQKYGEADFRSIVQRNIERLYIAKEAALLSVAELAVPFQPINSLNALVTAGQSGGVSVQYPIDGSQGNGGVDTNIKDAVTIPVALPRANVTYKVNHEAVLLGGSLAENDSILEATEQLGAKMDMTMISELIAKKHTGNNVPASATWTTTGDPYADINSAINKIMSNSAVNPAIVASRKDAFTAIVPIEARTGLTKISVIDGLKVSLEQYIQDKLSCKIVYSRKPFNTPDNDTWPIDNEAIVIPTKDRKVGRFYTFDGGNVMPNMFVTMDEHGKRVSTNYWMKYIVAPNEKDGTTGDNRRISVITGIA